MPIKLSVVFVLLAGASVALGHEANPSRYTFQEDVRPIFVENCGGCHRDGGVAPMSLLSFQEAVPWANAIKMQVLEQRMPPWLPVEGVGSFRHQRTLTAEEIDILVDWAVGQTPEGDPLTAEERTRSAAESESAGDADLVLEPEADVLVTEDEYEKRLCLALDTGIDEARVATGFSISSKIASVLRRATIYEGASCAEGRPLATWLPDQNEVRFPEGTGALLDAGAQLAMELYYVKGWNDEGKLLADRPRLGVRFGASARPLTSARVSGPGYRLPEAASLVALYPVPAETTPEEPLRIDVRLPDGSTRALLEIERFESAWREKYVLAAPIALPAGAEIRVTRPDLWLDMLAPPAAAGE